MRESSNKNLHYLDAEVMRRNAPSVFATEASEGTSERYSFIPTTRVLDVMAKEGWGTVSAKQSMTRGIDGMEYAKHMLRLRKPGTESNLVQLNDVVPEVILTNSHDRSSCFVLMVGLFRLVCLNGLMVSDRTFSEISIRHVGYTDDMVSSACEKIVTSFKEVTKLVTDCKAITLTQEQRIGFADAALYTRWGEKPLITPEQVLSRRRLEDDPNTLWGVFNTCQENLMKGGQSGQTINLQGRSRRVSVREIRGVQSEIELNVSLWDMMVVVRDTLVN